MKRASDLFNESQRRQIEQAVVSAEAQTSCEIVPVVATASGRYDRAEDVVGLWLAAIAAAAVWLLMPRRPAEIGAWDAMPLIVELLILVGAIAVAFLIGAVIGTRIGWLRRLFTPRRLW